MFCNFDAIVLPTTNKNITQKMIVGIFSSERIFFAFASFVCQDPKLHLREIIPGTFGGKRSDFKNIFLHFFKIFTAKFGPIV